jgi:hypothetical protein
MQRILKQADVLRGDKETAEKNAKYTWDKDEIAWRYCSTTHSINRAVFTGKRWLVGGEWGYSKIYQFKVLSSSSGLEHRESVWHDAEDAFFETLESACEHAMKHINRLLEFQTSGFMNDMDGIKSYKLKETTFKKEVITEKHPVKNG